MANETRASKDSPEFAKSVTIIEKDRGASQTDAYHPEAVIETCGIGISLENGTFKINDILQGGQAYKQGARVGDFVVGINDTDVKNCMNEVYSIQEFSAMMKIAKRPLILNINHIKRAAPKPRALSVPALQQETRNPMIAVFIMFAILAGLITGVWNNEHPIVTK